MSKHIPTLLFSAAVLVSGGCSVKPKIIQKRHWQINEMIRATHIEQLLVNIVRLRYEDNPYFLEVSSITTQFAAQSNVGVNSSFPEGGANVYGLSAGAAYTEAPVVTWSLPDSRHFYGLMLAPMGADQLTSLASAGWDATRVLQAGVKKMNRLRNKEFRVEEGIYTPPEYDEFREALKLMSDLSREGVVDFAYGVKSSMGGGKIPMAKMDARAIPNGLAYGLQFMTRADPNVFEPLKLSKPLFLRFSKKSDADPRAKHLRELLDLDPGKYSFGIVDTGNSGVEQLRSESGKLSQVMEEHPKLAEIVVNNRSIMEMLFFASAFVEVPEAHVSAHIVQGGPAVDLGWLTVRSSAREPSDAWLKVHYRGYWFYIPATDLASRTSLGLLDALFESVVGNVPGAKPLLTLPVK